MKIKDWKKVRPFEYFMEKMEKIINSVREELLNMHKLGHLRCRYNIEKNFEMAKRMQEMVTFDLKIQVLVGDELKQDQFRFFYDCTKILFDSALQENLFKAG